MTGDIDFNIFRSINDGITICLLGAVAVGFFGMVYYSMSLAISTSVAANAETVFIELSKQLFNSWVASIFLAAILAAVMSTLSCQLLVCSSALTGNIYKTFFRKQVSQPELVWIGRAMVLLIAIILAADSESKILKMVSYACAGFGAAFGPVIILSLIWSRMNKNGALTVLIWKQYALFGLYEIILGFLFSSLAVIIVNPLTEFPIYANAINLS